MRQAIGGGSNTWAKSLPGILHEEGKIQDYPGTGGIVRTHGEAYSIEKENGLGVKKTTE